MNNTQPYLTATELGIQDWEHAGLVALIGPLSRGDLAYNQGDDCGTAMCIGGWLAFMNGYTDTSEYVTKFMDVWGSRYDYDQPNRGYTGLAALYWGNTGEGEPNGEQGAQAITNFLMTGNPQWPTVMSTT